MSNSSNSESEDDFMESGESESDQEDYGVAHLHAGLPYENEPLAPVHEDGQPDAEDDLDCDLLSREDIEARFENVIPVDRWCSCNHCSRDLLCGAREHRCCREIQEAVGKLTFDGSIERISCITMHEDFIAITNATNLMQVGPLLRDRAGRPYRQRAGHSRNEYWYPQSKFVCCVLDQDFRAVETLHYDVEHVTIFLDSDCAVTEDDEDEDETSQYCPHYVGHYLGMDVHDTPLVSRGLELQPGMVITIEPGLYIPSNAYHLPSRYRGIGIRIEDDVLISEKEPTVLTSDCPKGVEDIEKLLLSN